MNRGSARGPNRRKESRYQPCLEEVLWRSEGSTGRALRGCLRDVSDQGLSFVTARQPAPQVGTELHVQLLGTQECAPCRVMWIAAGRQLAAVGCRVLESPPDPSLRKMPEPQFAGTA